MDNEYFAAVMGETDELRLLLNHANVPEQKTAQQINIVNAERIVLVLKTLSDTFACFEI